MNLQDHKSLLNKAFLDLKEDLITLINQSIGNNDLLIFTPGIIINSLSDLDLNGKEIFYGTIQLYGIKKGGFLVFKGDEKIDDIYDESKQIDLINIDETILLCEIFEKLETKAYKLKKD